MAEVASAFVALLPSAKGFGSKLDSQIGPEVKASGDRAGKTFGGGLLGGFKGIALGLGAAFAATGAISFVKDSVQGFQDHLKVAALTAQAIKSTGGAAKVTADQVGALSDKLEAQTGVDGDLIQNGANLLLTFTNVRNEVGKGNDIFNQATQTITDMSVALGQDTKGSAIQLGKALNDPIKGVTALSKVGVSFTQQQKDQISTLVKSGKTLDAQKVILAELNKEFGGAAAAASNPFDRMLAVFHGLQDQVGGIFLPLMNNLADYLGGTLIPAVQDFITQFQDGNTFLNPFVDGIGRVKDAVVGLFDLFVKGDYTGTLGRALGISEDDQIVATMFQIRDVVLSVVGAVRDNLAPALTAVGAILAGALIPTLAGAFTAVAGVLSAPVLAIAALGAGLVLLYQRSETFRAAVAGVFAAVQSAIAAATPIAQQFIGVIQQNMPTISAIFNQVGQVVTAVVGLLGAQIGSFVQIASALWKQFGGTIIAVVKPVFAAVLGVISGTLTVITGVIRAFTALLRGDWQGVWTAVQQIASGALNIVGSIIQGGLNSAAALFTNLGPMILSALGNLGSLLYGAGQAIMRGLINGIRDTVGELGGVLGNVTQFIQDHKGPPEKDAVLLRNNGRLIMNGLIDGLNDGAPALERKLNGLTATVSGMPYRATPVAGAGGVGAGAGGVVVNLNGEIVTTDTADAVARAVLNEFGKGMAVLNLAGVG